ncbi:MAG TPA: arginase family protein [Candidatus Nitrosopolaris sp.]|nr:arginase family protein [Candidatus Nitrosopolaris sp.]
MKSHLDVLSDLFIPPERTSGKYSFADIPVKVSFEKSNVLFYGAPIDLTTSFGKGTSRGPEAIRLTSARQIETFLLDEKVNIYERAKIFDIGDLKIPASVKNMRRTPNNLAHNLSYLGSKIHKITSLIHDANKLPVLMGGEHTLSYYALKALSDEKPLVIHFDAHRDMKPEYEGIKMCHTTPFYHIMNDGYIPGKNIIQIGIRQTDREENEIAKKNRVMTFDAWEVHDRIDNLLGFIQKKTRNVNIYISFDIDVYDSPYVPCTGTPEPFGLDPFEVRRILKNICLTAKLVGVDIVEVGLRNDDYREGTLASQTLLRILSRLPDLKRPSGMSRHRH